MIQFEGSCDKCWLFWSSKLGLDCRSVTICPVLCRNEKLYNEHSLNSDVLERSQLGSFNGDIAEQLHSRVGLGNDKKNGDGLEMQKSGTQEEMNQKEYKDLVLKDKPISFGKGSQAIAGALAGVFVSLCLHPIDTVKAVLQSRNGGSNCSVFRTITPTLTQRGILGLYRGLGIKMASSAPISAIYTFSYESVKGALLPRIPKEYHALAHCVSGGCASVTTSFVYTPSECVKLQMQVGRQYRNSLFALAGILKEGGISTLYAGWVAVLLRNVPQSMIKFSTYESLKGWLLSREPHDGCSTELQRLAIGGIAGSTAALFTNPFDVVKTRIQTQTLGSPYKYKGVFDAMQRISSKEGLKTLYRGLVPRLVIYMSQGALFFASYEFFKDLFSEDLKHQNALTDAVR